MLLLLQVEKKKLLKLKNKLFMIKNKMNLIKLKNHLKMNKVLD